MPQYGSVRKRPNTITTSIRNDPVPRDVTGTGWGNKFKNLDPTRRYVGVFARNEESMEQYLSNGYRIEVNHPDGIKPLIGSTSKEGEPVLYRGHVMMSISIAEYKRQQMSMQGQLDAARMSLIAKRDEDGRFIKAAAEAGIQIDKHDIQVPLPHEMSDGGNNG